MEEKTMVLFNKGGSPCFLPSPPDMFKGGGVPSFSSLLLLERTLRVEEGLSANPVEGEALLQTWTALSVDSMTRSEVWWKNEGAPVVVDENTRISGTFKGFLHSLLPLHVLKVLAEEMRKTRFTSGLSSQFHHSSHWKALHCKSWCERAKAVSSRSATALVFVHKEDSLPPPSCSLIFFPNKKTIKRPG